MSLAPAYVSGWSTDMNNQGLITGYLYINPTGYHAVAWPHFNLDPVDLGTLGGNQSEAIAINAAGDIVGWSELTAGSATRHATLWPASGGMVDLNTWPNPCPGSSEAADVSDVGVIVGRCDGKPALWTHAEGMRLLPLPSNIATGDPRALNNDGTVVGMAPASFGGALGTCQSIIRPLRSLVARRRGW